MTAMDVWGGHAARAAISRLCIDHPAMPRDIIADAVADAWAAARKRLPADARAGAIILFIRRGAELGLRWRHGRDWRSVARLRPLDMEPVSRERGPGDAAADREQAAAVAPLLAAMEAAPKWTRHRMRKRLRKGAP